MTTHRLLTPFTVLLLVFVNFSCAPEAELPPPNIVWITAEDMSPVLGYLGDTYAITPNLDALAKESIIYTHAFATSPVCSPSRAALTGLGAIGGDPAGLRLLGADRCCGESVANRDYLSR